MRTVSFVASPPRSLHHRLNGRLRSRRSTQVDPYHTLLAQAASSSAQRQWRSLGARSMLDARSPSASRRARATPPPLSAFASAFGPFAEHIGQVRRALTGHFFRNVDGQLNGQLLHFVATRNQK